MLAYGVHDLQEAGILPGLDTLACDVSHIGFLTTGLFATLVKAILNFSPQTTWLRWYVVDLSLVTTLVIYSWSGPTLRARGRPDPRRRRRTCPSASPRTPS